jgi:hypothetical protein
MPKSQKKKKNEKEKSTQRGAIPCDESKEQENGA